MTERGDAGIRETCDDERRMARRKQGAAEGLAAGLGFGSSREEAERRGESKEGTGRLVEIEASLAVSFRGDGFEEAGLR